MSAAPPLWPSPTRNRGAAVGGEKGAKSENRSWRRDVLSRRSDPEDQTIRRKPYLFLFEPLLEKLKNLDMFF